MSQPGSLILVPVSLGDAPWQAFLPASAQQHAARLRHFVVENARMARAQLKRLDFPGVLRETDIQELPDDAGDDALDKLLEPLARGEDVGLMSDAGCPAVADPGARLVARAHARGFSVIPLVGPSSILLGLMASGLNGQSFTFHGYLPVEEARLEEALRSLEKESQRIERTQIFIETPYRNDRIFAALLKVCQGNTQLCVAREVSTPQEMIRTRSIEAWRKHPAPVLNKHPTVFLMLARKNPAPKKQRMQGEKRV